MKPKIAALAFLAAVSLAWPALGVPPLEPDPSGVLRKPIPDRLVALTFDDSCASHATVVAPILKAMGFGGTFYIADFDSFRTRKDWYMTWRQMRAMADAGFEIGNHTVTHYGTLKNFVGMEDELLANNCPHPTTVCWPLYQADPSIYAALAAKGYTFGRGGHERPYRPTVDNPFDIPSYTIRDGLPPEVFVKQAQGACQGRIVVFTFHGVPDLEHAGVGLEPATFKAMMQYLKDNRYRCIALGDLAEYIDPAKAAKLPPTASNVKLPDPTQPLKDDKPFVLAGKNILEFAFPGLPHVAISKTNVSVTVPYGTDVTALAPRIKASPGATITPASGASKDFSKPQTYTVAAPDGSTKSYTVTVKITPISSAKEILTFELPGPAAAIVSGTRIGVYVPAAADITALAPTFTVSPFAKAVPASGTAHDFTKPRTYTITAQDGSAREYTATVVKAGQPNVFTWSGAVPGNWSDGSKWSNNLAAASALVAAGQSDYGLNFTTPGTYAVTNDLRPGFMINQLSFASGQGHGLKLGGNSLAFAANKATGNLPGITVKTWFGDDLVTAPIDLGSDLSVNIVASGRITLKGLISGAGSLVYNGNDSNGGGAGSINGGPNFGFSILSIIHAVNTYSGGTTVNGGTLYVEGNHGLGTGSVTLNKGAGLTLGSDNLTNSLFLNGGTLDISGASWNAPIVLHGDTKIAGHKLNFNNVSGGMSGPGGFTQIGTWATFSRTNEGNIYLCGDNTYTGPTTVQQGTLCVKKAVSLYHANTANWTAEKISVHPAATLVISAGGPDEFTSADVSTLLKNLTASIDNSGLMAGSVFCLDTSNAAETVVVLADLTDSKGPGGGAFCLKKCGTGALQLSGNNSYTGRTVLEAGTLSVASLNSVASGKASSSLGAPQDVEAGEIAFGADGKDGDCTLLYTGTGETTDRVLNFAGQKATESFDQSGSGLLKFSSPFLLSGYGASKTIVLKGDTAGTGEIAGSIVDPYDRAGKATTAVTKSGSGNWTLSGINSYSGPTNVVQGTLSLAGTRSLGDKTDVHVSDGAMLDLSFTGAMRIGKLYFDGKLQPAGTYSKATNPKYLKGTGVLRNQ